MKKIIPSNETKHQHLQQIIAGLSDGVILIDPDRTIAWVNHAALTMHGATTVGELGATAGEYTKNFKLTYRNKHELSQDSYPINRVLTGEVFDGVVIEVTPASYPDKHWIHDVRSLVLRASNETPELFVLVIQDVTERFSAEERFERTFNANPAPAVVCRLSDLRYVKVNRGFLEMTGFHPHEVIGRSIYEIDVMEGAEKREHAIHLLQKGETIPQMEACPRVAGDTKKYVIVAGQPIEIADAACMLFSFIDLDPHKNTETALRHSEERFAKAFKLAPVPMAVNTLEGLRFLDVNDAFVAISGYTAPELVGAAPEELNLWGSASIVKTLHSEFAKEGSVRNFEIQLLTKSGNTLDCYIAAERVTILDQACILSVVQNMSERKQTQAELLKAIESVMKDTTWFSQTVIEKLADLRMSGGTKKVSASLADLSLREREVLGLICEGKTDLAIAEQINLTRNTIRNHVTSIYTKIDVHNRSAAVVWARERGFTGIENPKTKSRDS